MDIFRVLYLLIAVFCTVLVIASGWLNSSHNRLAGILVMLLSALAVFMAVRPRRQ
jgi:hypothetical protein